MEARKGANGDKERGEWRQGKGRMGVIGKERMGVIGMPRSSRSYASQAEMVRRPRQGWYTEASLHCRIIYTGTVLHGPAAAAVARTSQSSSEMGSGVGRTGDGDTLGGGAERAPPVPFPPSQTTGNR